MITFCELFPSSNVFSQWLEERDAWFTCANGDYIGWRRLAEILDHGFGLNNINIKDIDTATECIYDIFSHPDNQIQDGTAQYLSGVLAGFLHAEARRLQRQIERCGTAEMNRGEVQ